VSERQNSVWIGQSIRRFEDPSLLLGLGRFTADLPSDLHLKFVRSRIAAGRIKKIVIPQSVRGYRLSDLGLVNQIRPLLHNPLYQAIGQPLLAETNVRFVGEPTVAIIAKSAAEAEDHCELVEVEIEPLDPLVDLAKAISPSAPLIHHGTTSNVIIEAKFETPNFQRVFQAQSEVIDINVVSRRQAAAPMEGRAAHAAFDAREDRVTLTSSTQNPHVTRTGIAEVLNIPESSLRVIAPDVGGGFGQKMSLPVEYCVAVALARMNRCSVAWVEDRHENLASSFHSREQIIRVRGAFNDGGRLLALRADALTNIGAYSCYPTTCAVEPLQALAEIPGPYDIQHYSCHTRGVATNTCPMSPYRGVSRPVLTFAMERMMDDAALHFKLDPVEIRRRNLVDQFPYRSATGLIFDEGTYKETLDIAARTIDIGAFRKRQQSHRQDGRYIGLGFSTFSERTGYGTPAFAARGMEIVPGFDTVEIAMDPSGFVEARTGVSPHGQGLRTTLAQIIADQLGLAPDLVRIVHGDTDKSPYGFGTFASRSIVIAGGAAMLAAAKLREKILDIAAHLLEAPRNSVRLEAGNAIVVNSNRFMPIRGVARIANLSADRLGGISPGLRESATYDPAGCFSNACHVAIVEVETDTGRVKLDRYLVVEDAGLLVNPMIVDGQIHGGVAQGIANALFEEVVYNDQGENLTTTFADYLVPTIAEIPTIEIQHVETLNSDATVTKSKGLGEGGTIGCPAAVINAINDALLPFGVRMNEFPATPKRIRNRLRVAMEGKR
jgi:aerobic carbon-monoxide dehydrogenase large subunit